MGYLKDDEGSWKEIWRTGSSLISWVTLFDPQEVTLKDSCQYRHYKCIKNGRSFMGVLGGFWGFLSRDWEDMVILDVKDDLILPQGRYPESLVFISLLEVCQELGVLHGGTRRSLRIPDRKLGEQANPWCHGWPCFTPRKILWKFHGDIFIGRVWRMEFPSCGYLEDVEGSWQETRSWDY